MFKIIIISGIQIILSLSYIVIYISISFVESTPLEKHVWSSLIWVTSFILQESRPGYRETRRPLTQQVGSRVDKGLLQGNLIIYNFKEYNYLKFTLCFPSFILNSQNILITSPKHYATLGLLCNSCDTNLGNKKRKNSSHGKNSDPTLKAVTFLRKSPCTLDRLKACKFHFPLYKSL